MRSDIVPPNRFITIALVIGILALIAYGAYQRDPATLIIVLALAVFFGFPAALLFLLNRRARQQQTPPPAESASDERDTHSVQN